MKWYGASADIAYSGGRVEGYGTADVAYSGGRTQGYCTADVAYGGGGTEGYVPLMWRTKNGSGAYDFSTSKLI